MTAAWRSLRVQLAVLGFLAIYVPVLLLFGVTSATEDEQVVDRNGEQTSSTSSSDRDPWSLWTVVVLGPTAAALAWWLAGRAVRPIERVRAVAEDIEATDLGRRIGLEGGPSEVRSLAASFDGMLDRLQQAAELQRALIEETSHELRTPLSVLTTNADVLLAHPDPTEEDYREGLARSKAAASRLGAAIDDLLVDARGRARAIDRRPHDLMALVRQAVDDVRVLAESERIELRVAGAVEAPCAVDAATVGRAVSNLLRNAIRHAPGGSAVDIRVEPAEAVAAVVVVDHGPGIPADELGQVFERYWRSGSGPGTGLGLPIARQVAQAHGGDLTVASPGPDGDGCAFRLSLRR